MLWFCCYCAITHLVQMINTACLSCKLLSNLLLVVRYNGWLFKIRILSSCFRIFSIQISVDFLKTGLVVQMYLYMFRNTCRCVCVHACVCAVFNWTSNTLKAVHTDLLNYAKNFCNFFIITIMNCTSPVLFLKTFQKDHVLTCECMLELRVSFGKEKNIVPYKAMELVCNNIVKKYYSRVILRLT